MSTGDNNLGRVIATMTGLLLMAGRAELLARRTWGRMVGLLELGAVIYSTGNSMADTTRNKLTLPRCCSSTWYGPPYSQLHWHGDAEQTVLAAH
jgi:hypothetical protein